MPTKQGEGTAYGSISIVQDNGTYEETPLLRGTVSSFSDPDDPLILQWWNQLVFGWFTPVLDSIQASLDRKESPNLQNDPTIPPLPPDDRTKPVYELFEEIWAKEVVSSSSPSVAKCLWISFRSSFIYAGGLKLIHDLLQFVGPQVLNGLILYLRDPDAPVSVGISLTVIVSISQLLMSLTLRHYFFACYRVGMRLRTALLVAIYKKSLTIDPAYYQDHPIGQVTNLMSVDVQRLQEMITYLHAIWYSFLQIGLALYFLWQQLGPSCLAGVAVILASIPLTAVTGKWMGTLQKKLMTVKDDRVQSNQEVLSNMKIVKLQAWEVPFLEQLKKLRNMELKELLRYLFGQATTWLLWSAVPLLIALATFGAYVTVAHRTLDVASALTALTLFGILRFPLFMFPMVINMLVEGGVAVKRIQDFLVAPDIQQPPPIRNSTSDSNTDSNDHEGAIKQIVMQNATFTYQDFHDIINPSKKKVETAEDKLSYAERELMLFKAKLADTEEHLARLEGRSYGSVSNPADASSGNDDAETDNEKGSQNLFSLRRINFECKPGEFVAVVGAVGSGKSTFLQSILGEVQRVAGSVNVQKTKIGYAAQSPFIMNNTVKGNILFGKPDEKEDLYGLAIKCCALEHDLDLLPDGDQCEIGEKGITLSGGQKARLAMARVVYHDPEISLLDDVLSAVDAHVGRELFDECICKVLHQNNKGQGPAEKKRTVVLVTNALQYLNHPLVNRIVVLDHGTVVETGTYKELSEKDGSQFKVFLDAYAESMTKEDGQDGSGDEPGTDDIPSFGDMEQPDFVRSSSRGRKSIAVQDPAEVNKKGKRHLMTDEMAEREFGKVDKQVYMTWANAAGGLWIIIPLFFVFCLGEFSSILSNWWLTYWSHAATPEKASQLHFLAIYAVINISAILAEFLRMATVVLFALKASRGLFFELLEATLAAPMSFFDTTPTGRIINRFSKDIYTLDEALPASFRTYVSCIFSVLSTLVVITSVTPIFAVTLIPILFYYRRQQEYFSQCYRELKRIDAVSRSPIYSLFGETLDGPATVRAFDAEIPLFNRIVGLIDTQQLAYYLTQSGLCWLAVRLEIIGTFIITCACTAAVLEKRNYTDGNEMFAGLAGLSISYALSVTQALNWAVRTGSDFEANMVSVERIRQYCNLGSEAPQKMDGDDRLGEAWPEKGVIEFQNAKLRYRPDLPLVLKGLNLTIPARSKVGVVGRTGAGKSTLMTALMRLVELDSGKILLDGVDTKTLGLCRLRSSIAVIPQDPVLFSGTVKNNLDPFGRFNDGTMKDVLQRVGLYDPKNKKSAISSLEDRVLQDGSNFSVGQRQLLVIARALLDGAGVVICDEATAAIDAEADARIQRVLRSDFAGATTLTVAHRLNTIMDSTHILVMSNGKAEEFDTPAKLLAKGGLFKELVDKWEEEHGE